MTKGAFGFVAVGLAVYLVASQTQVGWLYLFDAIIWSLLGLSAILPGYSLKSLQVEQQIVLPAARPHEPTLGGPLEDETIEVKLKVSNSGRLARYFVKLAADCPFEQPEARQKHFLLSVLNPGSSTVLSYTAGCYRRGYYTSASIVLESGGPLGLFVGRRSFQLPLKLTVYPRYYRMGSLPVAGEDWVEWGQGVKSSSAAEFYGSRNYQYGDPLKHVHWRNTARTGHFMIKEFEQSQQGSLTVVFDTIRDFGAGRETTLEYSIKIAASLAKLCADSGRVVDIITGKTSLHNADWQAAMDYLARLEVTEKGTYAGTMISGVSQALVAVVPAVEAGQTLASAQLAGWERGVVVLLEGFASDEVPEKVISSLQGKNLEVVHCFRGNLEAAINRLSGSVLFTGALPGGTG